MTDAIILRKIAVFAYHGALDEEARLGQRFLISLVGALDLRKAGQTDDLAHGVHYGELAALAIAVATQRRFRLLEALAETIAAEALARFPPLTAITVLIEKPAAPIAAILDCAAVEITRRRAARE